MPELDVRAAVEAAKDEDVSEEVTEELSTEDPKATTEEFSDVELEAMDLGWNPDGAEGKRSLSPEEFIERKTFYDEIKNLKKQLKQNNAVVSALKEHNDTIAEKSYERAIKELKEQKKVAAADEDLSTVIAIEEQIEAVKEDKKNAETVQATAAPHEWDTAFNDFSSDNIWYGRVPEMTQRADALGREYMQSSKTPTPDEFYKHVQKGMKQEFSDEFGTEKPSRRKAAPAVASPQSGGKTPTRAKKHSLSDLDDATRKIADTLISGGIITKEKYLKDYFSE